MYTVVIIDDEPWTRDVIRSLGEWEKLGMEVVGEAADGETGWILVKNVLPDIVITDVRMPRINGLDLIGLMRRENILSPAIVISGYDDYEYVHKALKLGVVDYLLKPIKPEDLNKQLSSCIDEIRKNKAQLQSDVRAEFIPEHLQKECKKIFKELEIQLQIRKKNNVKSSLEKLEELIIRSEGGNPSLSIQIGIYYELFSVLQNYIVQRGYQRKEVLDDLNNGYVFSRESKLHQMLEFFTKRYIKTVQYVEDQVKKKKRVDTDAIVRFLEEHYMEGITLEETADYFYISKEYLSKVFKMDRKIGFSDYLLKLRMEKAKELIEEYQAPIKEVGLLVGYVDIAHFYKNFKKYHGITPGEMRNSLKIDNDLR
ncbi:MAG: hypothetical protein PWP24_726 [Clostridiales bacterium]|nr:hypothetical protein [Clostridiales bacterium]